MKSKILLAAAAAAVTFCMAAGNINITAEPAPGAVDLTAASIKYDPEDALVVAKAASLLADDIRAVTGRAPAAEGSHQQIIVGTVGESAPVDALVAAGKLDVSPIAGEWERYIIRTVDYPAPGVERALVIAGSDRRGTAYGVFALSEAIGVSPWNWWADVPAPRKANLFATADMVSATPSVKYRGIFINDEDWGLKPWSSYTYEPELGDIGPRTYARVCELLLRLKGNMLAPAMHTCTGAFYSHPESKLVADSFAIIITTSHCEPLLLNNASKEDWNRELDGEWDYGRNPEGIRNRWEKRLAEASQFENIYTMAMRGLHDEGLRGNYTMAEKVPMIEGVIADQRAMLSRHTGKQATEIPQIFVPYKETMDLYENGLQVPDDITLVWVDDNYGYMKRVSSPAERERRGGAGVYYHTSYLGAPHDYLWLNTTPPTLMYEELKKSYDAGADRYWLLNVGDIKPCELGMATFFDMAADFDSFSFDNINNHQADYLCRLFPSIALKDAQNLLDNYYRLAWSRKPEFMGWEREWDIPALEQLADTEYSFDNYNDARRRLADYSALSDLAAALCAALPTEQQPAFFEIIGYPAMASCQMNRKFLMAQLNHRLHADGDFAGANRAALESEAAADSIKALTNRYNSMLDGKWNHMMDLAPGWCAKYQLMPSLTVTEGVEPATALPIAVEPAQDLLEGCTVLDLSAPAAICGNDTHTIRLLDGVGYDWVTLMLGDSSEPLADPTSPDTPHIDYRFQTGSTAADSVEVTLYMLPTWPLYGGRENRFGIRIDNSEVIIFANNPKEYSPEWKTQVLCNAAVFTARLPLDTATDTHTLTLLCGDPGIMLQRIVVDWGGLKKSYVGPSASLSSH